jgi:hypothetical protein
VAKKVIRFWARGKKMKFIKTTTGNIGFKSYEKINQM